MFLYGDILTYKDKKSSTCWVEFNQIKHFFHCIFILRFTFSHEDSGSFSKLVFSMGSQTPVWSVWSWFIGYWSVHSQDCVLSAFPMQWWFPWHMGALAHDAGTQNSLKGTFVHGCMLKFCFWVRDSTMNTFGSVMKTSLWKGLFES